jgi:YjjW family glycine radical enzyme activase
MIERLDKMREKKEKKLAQSRKNKVNKVVVNKIIPFSSIDGPGNRTVIFLQGCNFDCLYCHNPETINICNNCGRCVPSCPTNALDITNGKVSWEKELCVACDKCIKICERDSSPRVKKRSVKQILKEIEKSKAFISGITVSGGEASLQADFLHDLFYEVKKKGLSTFLDTNGSILLEEKSGLLKYLDMAMIDAKSFSSKEHQRLTGKGNNNVIQNIKFMAKIDKLYEVRTVIVPDELNNNYNVDKISSLLGKIAPEVRYKLIKYRPVGVRTDRIDSSIPKDEYMEKMSQIAVSNGCQNVVLV